MVGGQYEPEPDEDNRHAHCAPRSPATLHGWKKWLRIVFALFVTVGVLASIASLYLEIRAGRGGELHRSMWGYKVSPIGALVGVGTAVAAWPAISIIGWLLRRRDRTLARGRRKPT